MTVQVAHRLTFVADAPLAIGGAAIRADADLGVAVDGLGRYVIPGSSAAGVLRSRLAGLPGVGPEDLDVLFGGDTAESASAASRVTVDDAIVVLPDGSRPFVRAGVGIDRRTGTAAPAILHDRVVLPAGSTVELCLVVDGGLAAGAPDPTDVLVEKLLEALARRPLRIGAGTSRGLGVLRLVGRRFQRRDLTSREGLLAVLRSRGEEPEEARLADPTAGSEQVPDHLLDVEIAWRPVGPLMVKSTREGLVADHLPYGEDRVEGWRLVVPGSSVKGAFRSTAERIVRTVFDLDVAEPFGEQLNVPLVEDLFGSAPSSEARGSAGVIWFDDVVATDAVHAEIVAALGTAENDADLLPKLDGHGGDRKGRRPAWTNGYHVAIDRWTGGAAKGPLYSGIEPWGEAWEPLHFSVDVDALRRRVAHRVGQVDAAGEAPVRIEDQVGAALQLLVLVLREFAAGRIPLGFATNRGYGSIQTTRIDLKGAVEASLTDETDERWPVKDERWKPWSDGWSAWLAGAGS